MKGRALTTFGVAVVLLSISATPAMAALSPSPAFSVEWNRLNPDFPANVNNEHERLTCREGAGSVTCFYDKVPESLPGFTWNATIGNFTGRDVSSSWTCPAWFPSEVCTNAGAVYGGVAVYHPAVGQPFTVTQDYVFTNIGGHPALYQYWVGRFACPWYATFAEALAANPGHAFDCAVAP
jgi:hypothetical protein